MSAPTIMALFEEWNALRGRSDEPGLADDEVDCRCQQTDAVMHRLLALPTKTAADLAAKLMCFTHYGNYALDEYAGGDRLMMEMAAMVGYSEKLADKFLPTAGGPGGAS